MTTYSFYIYAPSALPYDSATDSFTFDANYSFSTGRVELIVTDDDQFLDGDEHNDEVGEDANQTGVVRSTDGTEIASGLVYAEQWGLIRAPDGTEITIDRIEIGGQLVGYSPSQLLEPGVTYEYITGGDIDNSLASQNGLDTRMSYAEYQAQSVPGFGPGTRIDTHAGPTAIDALRKGDLVVTRDHGLQPVLWVSRSTVDLRQVRDPGQKPVAVPAPLGDLVVSGSHRVLAAGPSVELLFGTPEVLVKAKDLVRIGAARRYRGRKRMTYSHLLFAHHQVIRANGLWVESLLGTAQALQTAPALLRGRVQDILADTPPRLQTARPCLKSFEVALLGSGRASRRQAA